MVGGGTAMRNLIEEIFNDVFAPPGAEDQARLTSRALQELGVQLAFATDSFVVSPPIFPGGDIGKIAVCGTVNDLAVGGAVSLWLSAGFISRKAAISTCCAGSRLRCSKRPTRLVCAS